MALSRSEGLLDTCRQGVLLDPAILPWPILRHAKRMRTLNLREVEVAHLRRARRARALPAAPRAIKRRKRKRRTWPCVHLILDTVMVRNKNGCSFSKGACCSCPLDTRGPWAATLDMKNGTATLYMKDANGGCRRALLFLPRKVPKSA